MGVVFVSRPLADPLLPLGHGELLEALVLHGGDALLGQVLLDLGLVHAVDRHRPPQLDELVVWGEEGQLKR